MNIQDYRQTFYDYSAKASDLTRQLAFAGIALIWLFKKDNAGAFALPQTLLWPTFFIVCALGLDLLHYCVASIIWRSYYRSKEKVGLDETKDLPHHSTILEIPIFVFFVLKILCTLIAYFFLFRFCLNAVSFK